MEGGAATTDPGPTEVSVSNSFRSSTVDFERQRNRLLTHQDNPEGSMLNV